MKKTPANPFPDHLCEACNKEPAWSFSFDRNGVCRLTGSCTTETEFYYIEFHRFFVTPKETVGWFAHLKEKNWYKVHQFTQAIARLARYV